MFPTHLKVLPQLLPGVAPSESICAQHDEGTRDEFTQLIRVRFLVISRGDKRTLLSRELLREVGHFLCLSGMQTVPANDVITLSCQLIHAGEAPDVSSNPELAQQKICGSLNLPQDGTRTQQLNHGS